MTLTELRYIIAIAQTKHFGRAAELCQVSQPSLSVAVKKLETELGIKLFERKSTSIMATPLGESVIEQAQRVLEEADKIVHCVQVGKDPLSGPLTLGVIYSIAPFLIPNLVGKITKIAPSMPLVLTEGKTAQLIEQLKNGQIDAAVMALPVDEPTLNVAPLYNEEFLACVPVNHRLAKKETVSKLEIRDEPLLLLGPGHCLRDQILSFCYDATRNDPQNPVKPSSGTSLETIVYMVAQGLGATLLPASAYPYYENNPMLRFVPFSRVNVPKRTVALVWRKTFPRLQAVAALYRTVRKLSLYGCDVVSNDTSAADSLFAALEEEKSV